MPPFMVRVTKIPYHTLPSIIQVRPHQMTVYIPTDPLWIPTPSSYTGRNYAMPMLPSNPQVQAAYKRRRQSVSHGMCWNCDIIGLTEFCTTARSSNHKGSGYYKRPLKMKSYQVSSHSCKWSWQVSLALALYWHLHYTCVLFCFQKGSIWCWQNCGTSKST